MTQLVCKLTARQAKKGYAMTSRVLDEGARGFSSQGEAALGPRSIRVNRAPWFAPAQRRLVSRAGLLFVVMAMTIQASAGAPRDVSVTPVFPTNPDHMIMGICFHDGAMYGAGKDNVLIKYDPATGEQLELFDPMIPDIEAVHIHGLTNGTDDTFWVADALTEQLFQLRFSDRSLVSVIDAPFAGPPHPPYGLTWQGSILWVGYHSGEAPTPVYATDPQTGNILDTLEFGVCDNHGMAWIGEYLWALDNINNLVYQVFETGEVRNTFGLPDERWYSLAYDGTHLWTNSLDMFFHINVPTPVVGDLNGDGAVNAADLAILLGSWGPCESGSACSADLDGDRLVGAADLASLLGHWS